MYTTMSEIDNCVKMLCNTESSAPCSVMTQRAGMGGWLKREAIHVYIQLIRFVVQQKSTKHCKAIKLQFKKLSKSYTAHFRAYNSLEDHVRNLNRCRIHLVLCVCLPFVTEHSICLNNPLAGLLLTCVPFPSTHLFTTCQVAGTRLSSRNCNNEQNQESSS